MVPLLANSIIDMRPNLPLLFDGGSTGTVTTVTDIATADGLVFTARTAGPEDGPPVLLLHGFPQTSRCWAAQLDALASGWVPRGRVRSTGLLAGRSPR